MKKMEQFVSQDQHSYSLYFDLKIWFWAWKVSGTFGKRASENFLHSKQWRIQGRGRPFPSLFLDQTEQEILFGLIAKTRYRKLFFPNTPTTPAALPIFSEEAFIQVRVKSTEDLETNTSLTYNWMKEECDHHQEIIIIVNCWAHLNNVLLLSWTDCQQQYWVSKKVISMHAWDGYTCRFSLGMADINFLLTHCRWGTFREEECLRLSDRNSILMTWINVYIINPVVMGFQMQICSILHFSWSILVKCCVHLWTWTPAKLKCFF